MSSFRNPFVAAAAILCAYAYPPQNVDWGILIILLLISCSQRWFSKGGVQKHTHTGDTHIILLRINHF